MCQPGSRLVSGAGGTVLGVWAPRGPAADRTTQTPASGRNRRTMARPPMEDRHFSPFGPTLTGPIPPRQTSPGMKKILIVDDEPAVLFALSEALADRRRGVKIATATNGS